MLSDDLIAKIATGIETMPPKPASRREIALLIARVEAKIRAAQERGCTYTEIAKQITDNGYPIKASTLRLAILRRKKAPSASRTPHTKQASQPSSTTRSKPSVLPPMRTSPTG